jgi:hypothetical protein
MLRSGIPACSLQDCITRPTNRGLYTPLRAFGYCFGRAKRSLNHTGMVQARRVGWLYLLARWWWRMMLFWELTM